MNDQEINARIDEYEQLMADSMGLEKMPSGKRMLVSTVTQFFVVGAGSYAAAEISASLALVAMTMTSSAFLAYMVMFLTMALAICAALLAGAKVGKYIATGQLDDDAKRAKRWVIEKLSNSRSKIETHFFRVIG